MITKELASKIAEAYLADMMLATNYNLVLLIEVTQEFDKGWVFFYQSKEYVETGDIMHMLGGNAPIIISKNDGTISLTGTAYPVEKYIEDYRRKTLNDDILEEIDAIENRDIDEANGFYTTKAYIEGYVQGLSQMSGIDLTKKITNWFQKSVGQRSSLSWTGHLEKINKAKSDSEQKSVLLSLFRSYFIKNPDWAKKE